MMCNVSITQVLYKRCSISLTHVFMIQLVNFGWSLFDTIN